MTTNPSWTLSPAAQAAQWSQQYGAGSTPGATNPSWEIARKALEKLGDSSSGEAGSSGEGSGKESKSSPEKKKKGDGESEGGKSKDPTSQEAPDFMSQQHQMNMYGNYYGQPYGGGGGMYPYQGYGPGYGMPPSHHMRGGPYQGMHGYPGPPGGMYPPYGPRPPYGDHRGPGFPPQHNRGPMAQGPPPPPPAPPHSLLGRPDPPPQPPLPPPSSKSSSANSSQQSQAQVSGESDGGGGGGGRGGDGHGFTPGMKFRQESQQLNTGSRWNKNFNQPSDTPGVRFSLPSKRSGMHPSPMTDGPRGQGQQANQFSNNKKKGGKQDNAGGQQPKKHTSA